MLTQHKRLMWSTPPAAAVLSSLFDCLRAAHADDGVRAIVITGAGKNFSAGADIKSFAAGAPLDGSVNEKFNSLIESGPKPTVAGEGQPGWQQLQIAECLQANSLPHEVDGGAKHCLKCVEGLVHDYCLCATLLCTQWHIMLRPRAAVPSQHLPSRCHAHGMLRAPCDKQLLSMQRRCRVHCQRSDGNQTSPHFCSGDGRGPGRQLQAQYGVPLNECSL